MTNDIDLTGRVALVMGASTGAARAVAIAFADAGAGVAVTTATPDAEEAFALRRLTKSITDRGRRTMSESVDMSLGTNVQIAVRQVSKEMGGIDILVVAPDLQLARPAERLSDADWARIVNLNLGGVFYACRAVGREMLGREPRPGETSRGCIIVLVTEPSPGAEGLAAYRAARAGALALVEALDAEWSPRGVSVRAIVLPPSAGEASDREAASLATRIASGTADDAAIQRIESA